MGAIVNGVVEEVDGLEVLSAFDDPAWRLSREDYGSRPTKWIRSIWLHTTLGIPSVPGRPGWENGPQRIVDGTGPKLAAPTVESWSLSKASGGAHLVVGQDARIICTCDLATEAAYHATTVNAVSIGIEMVQGRDGSLYADQLAATVRLVDWLTRRFGIQRQIHAPHRPYRPVARLASGGWDCVGVFGHRDQTANRGLGDPGDRIFDMLVDAGYEVFDFAGNADRAAWKGRQEALGISSDGVPGPATCAALEAAGHSHGLWVPRDGDVL